MDIYLNNKITNIENPTVEGILSLLEISDKGVAIAVNDVVISKSKWKEYSFTTNDRVTVIRATQGG